MRHLLLPALTLALVVSPLLAARSQRGLKPPALSDPAAYSPPSDKEGLERAFLQTIYRLERRQTGAPEAEPLADAINSDLSKLREEEVLAVMRLFLASAHHYEGMEDATLAEELRRRHDERFSDRLRDFAILSGRMKETGRDSAAGRLFARVRALAGPGSAGLELSRRLAAADSENAAVLTRLASDLADTGDLRGSIAASERAIRLSTDASRAYTTLASAKYQLKEYSGANTAATAALALDPGDKVAFAIVTLTRERIPAAVQAAEGSALDMNDDLSRERHDAIGAQVPPSPGAAALARGLAEEARGALSGGDYIRAEDLASQALEKDPQNVTALFRRARARMRQERLGEALADTQRALELSPAVPNLTLLALHAQVLNRMGRSAQALAAAERVLSLKPASDKGISQALFQKSWGLAGIGDRKGAMRTLAQAARLNHRYVSYYQEANAVPEDQDIVLVFSSDWLQEASRGAEVAANEPAEGWGGMLKGKRPMVILGCSLAGGLLIAFGLLRAASAAGPTPVPSAPAPQPSNGLLAGTYRLGRRIGSGGMGLVFEAVDVNLERHVAIKKMREEICADPRERERFVREARTVAALKHPNIVEIHSVVGDATDIYLVFEHVDGHTVTEYLQAYQRIPLDQAVRVTMAVASALDYAHARGVVHRDLKPSNIMITREGVVKVMDFGIARQAKDSMSIMGSTDTVSGTPQYMSPEQEAGTVRSESDVFSLGVCLYEMVTGVLPFQGMGGNMSNVKSKRIYTPATSIVAGLPPGTDQVFDWALDPDPDRRCKTPLKFAQALQDLLQPRIGLLPPDSIKRDA